MLGKVHQLTTQTSSSSCVNCGTAKYNDQSSRPNLCKDCPNGYVQNVTGKGVCNACVAGQYETGLRLLCSFCDPGTFTPIDAYIDGNNVSVCVICPNGFVQAIGGQSSCAACDIGFYDNGNSPGNSDDNDEVCEQCEKGKYQNNLGRTSCIHCSAGSVQAIGGQSSCAACDIGFYDNGNSPGNSDDDDEVCEQCEKGKYQNNLNRTSCIHCSAGSVQPERAKTECKICQKGQFDGSIEGDRLECSPCLIGMWTYEIHQTACKVCPPGAYIDEGNSTVCKTCPRGTYLNAEGIVDQHVSVDNCKNCVAGKILSHDTVEIISLQLEIHLLHDNVLDCLECDKGKYQPEQAEGSCTDCTEGKYNNLTGQTSPDHCLKW